MKNDLTPDQQENAIQNLIHKLTPEQMKEIGITDVSHIEVGQVIRIDKINDMLGSAKLMNINGESLINHAQHLGDVKVGNGSIDAEAASLGFKGEGAELKAYETFHPSTDAAREAVTLSTPPTTNGSTVVPHAPTSPAVAQEAIPRVPKAPLVTETIPLPKGGEAVRTLLEAKNYVGVRRISPDETLALEGIFKLQNETKLNPGLMGDITSAKAELLEALKGAKSEVSAVKMYKILEAHHLEEKVPVSPDDELMAYISSKRQ